MSTHGRLRIWGFMAGLALAVLLGVGLWQWFLCLSVPSSTQWQWMGYTNDIRGRPIAYLAPLKRFPVTVQYLHSKLSIGHEPIHVYALSNQTRGAVQYLAHPGGAPLLSVYEAWNPQGPGGVIQLVDHNQAALASSRLGLLAPGESLTFEVHLPTPLRDPCVVASVQSRDNLKDAFLASFRQWFGGAAPAQRSLENIVLELPKQGQTPGLPEDLGVSP